MRKKHWALGIILSLMLLIWGCKYRTTCSTGMTDCAVIAQIDFTPKDDTYNINWTGNKNAYSLVEHYVVHFQLDRNAPENFGIPIDIQEKRWYGWSSIGYISAKFAEGAKTPTFEYKRQCCGASTYPDGTPEVITDGTFWIGCTKKGKIKANGPKGDDSNATMRLHVIEWSYKVRVSETNSPKHEVNCK